MCYEKKRKNMVDSQIKSRGITSDRVINALMSVKRENFVSRDKIISAYGDYPLPIGHGQTISQPYIVALMSELAMLSGCEKVLEVGTGSGYQAAVLALLCQTVYSLERIKKLADSAEHLLEKEGFTNCRVINRDGYSGYAEEAPYDAIIVTASPPEVPEALKKQLKEGGRLVMPVGEHYQKLIRITRQGNRFYTEDVIPVAFVPMLPFTC